MFRHERLTKVPYEEFEDTPSSPGSHSQAVPQSIYFEPTVNQPATSPTLLPTTTASPHAHVIQVTTCPPEIPPSPPDRVVPTSPTVQTHWTPPKTSNEEVEAGSSSGPTWEPFGINDEATLTLGDRPQRRPAWWPKNNGGASNRRSHHRPSVPHRVLGPARLPIRERVLAQWRDYANQDEFFERMYAYYAGKGFLAIFLTRFLNLLVLGFVVSFTTFLTGCIDYERLHQEKSLGLVIIPQCVYRFAWTTQVVLVLFGAFYGLQIFYLFYDSGPLLEMRCFFTQILGITHAQLQTCPWNEVVQRLIQLRDQDLLVMRERAKTTLATPDHQVAHARRLNHLRLNAHSITNRIMRKENYLIALFNKSLLDLSSPLATWLPFGLASDTPHQTLTRALEWNFTFCLQGPVFDRESGQVNRKVLRESYRQELSEALRQRFIIMGCINLVLAPFIVVFLLLYFFFRYFEELYKNPGSLVSRQYTLYARWKFRDFNELPHQFQSRLQASYPRAVEYLTQFPQEITRLLARFAAFVAGSFAAVLLVLTVVDHDLSLEFEITPHKTVLFYIGLFGTIVAASRSAVSSDQSYGKNPGDILHQVVEFLHYMPDAWRGRMHTPEVRAEVEEFFDYKLRIYFRELWSVVTTPFILWFSLAPSSGRIVDFFREFTVHVDGIGYVCSFAVFDFRRHGNQQYGAPVGPTGVDQSRWVSDQGKMEQSFINFKLHHPDWEPSDPAASAYLARVQDTQLRLQQSQWLAPPVTGREPQAADKRQGKQPMLARGREPATGGDTSPLRGPTDDTLLPRGRSPYAPQTATSLATSQGTADSLEASNLMYLSAITNVRRQPAPSTPGVFGLVNQLYEMNNLL
ncbi:autophagy protein atg9 [Dispira parvispora]|uniref:Autophagy-related protein 9 n=1 Tax=Dispira parvispora TaxID=1520584 RepID=A0A9W8AYM5_9FUNG|nr:autophagy protein atg9 [Dispira parvispora]